MKKLSLMIIIAFLMCHLIDVRGQAIELNGFTGYQLGGKARLYDGNFRIDDSQNYGGKIAVGVVPDLFLEISYMRADTRGRLFSFTGEISDYLDFSSNYIHLGGLQQVDMELPIRTSRQMVQPFTSAHPTEESETSHMIFGRRKSSL